MSLAGSWACSLGRHRRRAGRLMGRLTPRGREAEMFGLYAFAGKSTAFLVPLALRRCGAGCRSSLGLATVLPFLIVGALILVTVDDEPSDANGAG